MGISRDSTHKRRATGAKRHPHRKKRKYELGRPPAMTKLGPHRVHPVRVRGGHIKHRALRLETGNFSWGSEAVTRKTRLLAVVYNASNNELVRTNTLVKNAIIQVDATPFRQWYEQHYGILLGKKKKSEDKKDEKPKEEKPKEDKPKAAGEAGAKQAKEGEETPKAEKDKSGSLKYKLSKRRRNHVLDPLLDDQFNSGRLYACVGSRPGQCGRCDGYILEGDELKFYLKKLQSKKKSKAT